MTGLKFIRMRRRLSIGDVAKYLRVSDQLVKAWEEGERGIPRKYQVKISELYGEETMYYNIKC